jgi:hypothetical protein
MRHLKKYESERQEVFGCDRDDVKECFDSYLDDFSINVVFGKKLHQFDVLDVNVTSGDISLGFQPYIRVRLTSRVKISPYDLFNYMNSDEFKESKLEVIGRLSEYDLEVKNVQIEVSSIIFLIYKS